MSIEERQIDSWRADEGSFKMFFSLEKYFRCYTSALPPAECVCVWQAGVFGVSGGRQTGPEALQVFVKGAS